MVLPGFDGEFRGGQTPTKGPLAEVIDRVNDMFRARNVDVTEGSVAGFITTFWGFLGGERCRAGDGEEEQPEPAQSVG